MIGILGVLGVYLRYFISIVSMNTDQNAAYATFVANSVGCLLAGSLFALIQTRGDSPILSALLIGFCGGLTTFSGYNLEFLSQLNRGLYSKACLYFIMGPIVGLLLIIVGYFSTFRFSKIL